MQGKNVIVFYHDGEKVSRKDGLCVAYNEEEIFLDNKIIIPKPRIVRIEILD